MQVTSQSQTQLKLKGHNTQVNIYQNEFMVEIYSNSLLRAIGPLTENHRLKKRGNILQTKLVKLYSKLNR